MSTHPVSIDLIKAKLHERIDRLVPELFPNARAEGREWVMGDIFGAPGRSLSICRTGTKAGWWRDFGGTQSGDILTLIAAGACDGDIKAAIPWALRWLGLGSMTPDELRRQEEKARRAAADAAQRQQSDAEKRSGRAKAMWLSGLPIAGTPVERYFLGRGCNLAALPRPLNALRWHPKIWNGEAGGIELPAMLAPFVDCESGRQLAVHRTWLALHADGRVTKAALREPKKSYGPLLGGVIPLCRGASNKPLKQMPAGEWLAAAEGIENAVSAALIRPDWRVVAAGTLGNLGEMKLPPQLGGVFLIADNDAKPEPQAAFAKICARLEARGIAFRIVRPPAGIKDFNDWLQALQAQGAVRTA